MQQDWNSFDAYVHSIVLPTLVAADLPQYRKRAQFSVNQLVKLQLPFGGEEFSDPRDFGGWGYGATADGAHFNWVIYALYAAKQWGLTFLQRLGNAPKNGFVAIRQRPVAGSIIE